MDVISLKPEGSARDQHTGLDVTAGSHWACGMPLSWVCDTANLWLSQIGATILEPDTTGPA